MVTTRYINNSTNMVEPVAGLAACMGFSFFATSPRLPLRKGLTEGGVAGFN